MMTYFPIPGEGAWVLLREFCQKQIKIAMLSLHTFKITTELKVNFVSCKNTFKCSVSVLEYFNALSFRSLNNRR